MLGGKDMTEQDHMIIATSCLFFPFGISTTTEQETSSNQQ